MKSYTKKGSKRTYTAPQIEKISLDNEISILMMSAAPAPTSRRGWGKAYDIENNDPFKGTMA